MQGKARAEARKASAEVMRDEANQVPRHGEERRGRSRADVRRSKARVEGMRGNSRTEANRKKARAELKRGMARKGKASQCKAI
jgi:hypothetical protein